MMKVGDRVKNINSGYCIENGPRIGLPVEFGTIVSMTDGNADIHWDGCEDVYCVLSGEFKLCEPREWWIAIEGSFVMDMVCEKPQDAYGYIHVREVIE